jgi:hypothetical protein
MTHQKVKRSTSANGFAKRRNSWDRAMCAAPVLSLLPEMPAIYRSMGIPLRETFTGDNGLPWLVTVARPDLLLWQEWAVVMRSDPVQSAINRAARDGIRYRLEKTIAAPKSPVVEVYQRAGGNRGGRP